MDKHKRPNNTGPEPLWGPEDVAAYLRVPTGTVYRWRCTGYGPQGTKVGKYVRYNADDVRAWFEAQQQGAA